MDEAVARTAAIKLQCLYRRRRAKKDVQKLFRRVVERVYDEESGDFFFYNVNTGESSWTAPSLLDEGTRLLSPEARLDMEDKIARGVWKSRETMTKVDAATTLQTLFRAVAARSRCRLLISTVFEKAIDPESGEAFYFNTRTGLSAWEKPALLGNDDLELTPRSKALLAEREGTGFHGICNANEHGEDSFVDHHTGAAAVVAMEIANAVLSAATERVARARPLEGPPSLHFEKLLAVELLDSIYGDALKVAAGRTSLLPAVLASELVDEAFMAKAIRLVVEQVKHEDEGTREAPKSELLSKISSLSHHAPVSAFIDKKLSSRRNLDALNSTPESLAAIKARTAELASERLEVEDGDERASGSQIRREETLQGAAEFLKIKPGKYDISSTRFRDYKMGDYLPYISASAEIQKEVKMAGWDRRDFRNRASVGRFDRLGRPVIANRPPGAKVSKAEIASYPPVMPESKREPDRGPRPNLYDRRGRLRSFNEVKPFEGASLLGKMAEYYGLNRAEYAAFGTLELALSAPLPKGWTEYVNRRNYTLYVNPSKTEAYWSHPADIFFFLKAREAIAVHKALLLWRNLSTRRHFRSWRISHAADMIWKLKCESSHFRALRNVVNAQIFYKMTKQGNHFWHWRQHVINIRRMAAIRCQNIWRLTKAMKDRPRLFDELRRDKAELRAKQEFMAARKIQKHWRAKMIRMWIRSRRVAIRRVIPWWRRVWRKMWFHKFRNSFEVARARRTRKIRMQLVITHRAAVVIQTAFRAKAARQAARKRQQRISIVQAQARRFLMTQWYLRHRVATIEIQRIWRGALVRSRVSLMNEAAVVIQRSYRGRLGRDRFKHFLHLKRIFDYETAAALNIQRVWRGFLVRRGLGLVKAARAYRHWVSIDLPMKDWERKLGAAWFFSTFDQQFAGLNVGPYERMPNSEGGSSDELPHGMAATANNEDRPETEGNGSFDDDPILQFIPRKSTASSFKLAKNVVSGSFEGSAKLGKSVIARCGTRKVEVGPDDYDIWQHDFDKLYSRLCPTREVPLVHPAVERVNLRIVKTIERREQELEAISQRALKRLWVRISSDLLEVYCILTVEVTEQIMIWRRLLVEHCLVRRDMGSRAAYLWNGINYVLKMSSDSVFLRPVEAWSSTNIEARKNERDRTKGNKKEPGLREQPIALSTVLLLRRWGAMHRNSSPKLGMRIDNTLTILEGEVKRHGICRWEPTGLLGDRRSIKRARTRKSQSTVAMRVSSIGTSPDKLAATTGVLVRSNAMLNPRRFPKSRMPWLTDKSWAPRPTSITMSLSDMQTVTTREKEKLSMSFDDAFKNRIRGFTAVELAGIHSRDECDIYKCSLCAEISRIETEEVLRERKEETRQRLQDRATARRLRALEREDAALCIQNTYRKIVCTRQYHDVIDKLHFKRNQRAVQKWLIVANEKARRMQARFYIWKARRQLKLRKKRKLQNERVIVLQCMVRSHFAARRAKKRAWQARFALFVQRKFRGRKARRDFRVRWERKRVELVEHFVLFDVVLSTIFESGVGRANVRYEAARGVQKVFRSFSCRLGAATKKRTDELIDAETRFKYLLKNRQRLQGALEEIETKIKHIRSEFMKSEGSLVLLAGKKAKLESCLRIKEEKVTSFIAAVKARALSECLWEVWDTWRHDFETFRNHRGKIIVRRRRKVRYKAPGSGLPRTSLYTLEGEGISLPYLEAKMRSDRVHVSEIARRALCSEKNEVFDLAREAKASEIKRGEEELRLRKRRVARALQAIVQPAVQTWIKSSLDAEVKRRLKVWKADELNREAFECDCMGKEDGSSCRARGFLSCPQDELERLRGLFDMYDKDHSGAIDTAEFQQLCYGAGMSMDTETAAKEAARIDVDDSGDITIDEFIMYFTCSEGLGDGEGGIRSTKSLDMTVRAQLMLGHGVVSSTNMIKKATSLFSADGRQKAQEQAAKAMERSTRVARNRSAGFFRNITRTLGFAALFGGSAAENGEKETEQDAVPLELSAKDREKEQQARKMEEELLAIARKRTSGLIEADSARERANTLKEADAEGAILDIQWVEGYRKGTGRFYSETRPPANALRLSRALWSRARHPTAMKRIERIIVRKEAEKERRLAASAEKNKAKAERERKEREAKEKAEKAAEDARKSAELAALASEEEKERLKAEEEAKEAKRKAREAEKARELAMKKQKERERAKMKAKMDAARKKKKEERTRDRRTRVRALKSRQMK